MNLPQLSFRRIILLRLLLFSIPLLMVGISITYSKARSAVLETAKKNLTQNAISKGDNIEKSIVNLGSNLVTASQTTVLKSGSIQQQKLFISQLAQNLPQNILCVQLEDLITEIITVNTCDRYPKIDNIFWQKKQTNQISSLNQIQVDLVVSANNEDSDKYFSLKQNELKLWLSIPVYDKNEVLKYALRVESAIVTQEPIKKGSFEGYPIVIDPDGIILTHPNPQKVGMKIDNLADGKRLKKIQSEAIAEKKRFYTSIFLDGDGKELLAGYTAIDSPVTKDLEKKWTILYVVPQESVLLPLKEIRLFLRSSLPFLILLTFFIAWYISRNLALPIEQIRDYTLDRGHLYSITNLRESFKIQEFNQLSFGINELVTQLRTWGKEIIYTWREAQNANKIKDEFLGNTSHELRTPLNGIINSISIIQNGYCDSKEEEAEFLQEAKTSALHLLKIIENVLDISDIEAGKHSVKLEKIDLTDIIDRVVELNIKSAQNKGLKFQIPNCKNSIWVDGDALKLKQILIHVVSNSIKFTEFGEISIQVKIEPEVTETISNKDFKNIDSLTLENILPTNQDLSLIKQLPWFYDENSGNSISTLKKDPVNIPKINKSRKVIIEIKDTGIGIDPTQQQQLFLPFIMADGSKTRKFGGNGLGLAISRHYIELMGGSITLYSAGKNRGTTIRITLSEA